MKLPEIYRYRFEICHHLKWIRTGRLERSVRDLVGVFCGCHPSSYALTLNRSNPANHDRSRPTEQRTIAGIGRRSFERLWYVFVLRKWCQNSWRSPCRALPGINDIDISTLHFNKARSSDEFCCKYLPLCRCVVHALVAYQFLLQE